MESDLVRRKDVLACAPFVIRNSPVGTSSDSQQFMSGPPIEEIVIVGKTSNGEVFRPSDWAERLCGCMSLFGEDQRISYSPYLKPIISGGVRCVAIDRRLEHMSPEAYRFLMTFCSDNELQTRAGRHEIRQSPPARPDALVLTNTKAV